MSEQPMTVPDRICGLEVEHRPSGPGSCEHWVTTNLASWLIDESRRHVGFQALRYMGGAGFGHELHYGTSADEAVAAVEASIRSVAEECRAFADKVLGER